MEKIVWQSPSQVILLFVLCYYPNNCSVISYYYPMSPSYGVQERTKRTIERTLLPNLNAKADRFRTADLHYFYKIKRNVKLEEWQRERDSQNTKHKFSRVSDRFSISPRLKLLSQHRVSPTNQTSRVQSKDKSFYLRPLRNKKQQDFNESYFNQNTFFFIKQDSLQYTEEDNFRKRISGTTLNDFSEQLIYQKLQDNWQKHQNKPPNPISLTRQIDSESESEGVEAKQPEAKTMKQDVKRKSKLSLISKNSSKASTIKPENKLLDLIYGKEQFIEKYKFQQMSLL